MNTQIPKFYDNKDLIYDEIWNLLSRGVVDRGEDFRLPTVILNDGKLSDGRVVVLRGAFKDTNTMKSFETVLSVFNFAFFLPIKTF